MTGATRQPGSSRHVLGRVKLVAVWTFMYSNLFLFLPTPELPYPRRAVIYLLRVRTGVVCQHGGRPLATTPSDTDMAE
jgi:hypothetical protein